MGRSALLGLVMVVVAACGGGASDPPVDAAVDARADGGGAVDAAWDAKPDGTAPDAGIDAAMIDASRDAALDAAMIDATPDAGHRVDASVDAAPADAASADAWIPSPDAAAADARPDASVDARPDASADAGPDAAPDARTDAAPDAPPFTLGASTLTGGPFPGAVDGSRDVARLNNPVNVALGPDGRVYVADFNSSRIRAVDAAGTVETIVAQGNFVRPFGLAFAADGTLYVTTDRDDTGMGSLMSGTIWRVDTAAHTATIVVRAIGRPRGIAVLPDGRLVLTDWLHHVVSLLDPSTGAITLLAGAYDIAGYADAVGVDARFARPYGVVVAAGPTIIVADKDNQRLRAIALDGTTTTIAGDGTAGWQDGAAATARFAGPQGVALDGAGALVVTDTDNYRIRRVAGGQVTTVAGDGVAGYLDHDDPLLARFWGLEGLAISADGSTIYVADGTRGDDTQPYHRVRRVLIAP
ncbi:MAG: SMP-30/gluconolactonase/LRE family protein [Deltaproteobacteria bacterium]|nr:SMP-30/gluconolactonase/LRE family protein [Deltaproteobacteria bacterium]